MENRPEQDERTASGNARAEEASAGMVPAAGTLELEQQQSEDVPAAPRRHTEVFSLPKVDRGAAPATPAIRPGETSTPATGTKSRTERKQEKKAARKEEKRNRWMEKSARQAEEAEAAKYEGTPARTPVRRKLDTAMENAGSIESVLLLEREYKALQRDPSHRSNFYFLIDRLISNLRYIPRTVFGPPAGEEERVKLTKLREEEEEAEDAEAAKKAAAGMEEADEGSASRKRKLEELEEKKRVLEEENVRKRKELEDEARRLRAVEEAERRAREQRSKNPKLQVPVAAEKAEATELVESYIQAYGPQQKKSKEAAATYASACKDSEQAQENFISALQKVEKKVQKQTDEDDEWEVTSESTENTENDGCSKKCTWCKIRKCTRKKPDHVHCSCTVCIQKYTEDLWRDQHDKVPEPSSSTQGPTGRKGSGTLEYMPPHVNVKGNRPAGQGGKSGRRGRAAMEPVAEERNEPTIPEQDGSLTQSTPEVEEQPPTYEDMYDMIVDPGTPDSTEERTEGPLGPLTW